MDLFCIKENRDRTGKYLTHGKWYPINSRTNIPTHLISDPSTYWNQVNMVRQAKDWVAKGYAYDELHKIIPGFKTIQQIDKEFTTYTFMESVVVIGDDGWKYYFIELTRQELVRKYGSCEFVEGVDFMEDYFITKENYRDDKINELLN
jgi:hypothetical protein